MSDNNMNGKDFLIGTLIGGMIGAAAALLLAPKKGSELRRDLSEQAHQVSERTHELADTVGRKSHEWSEVATQRSREVAGQISGRSREIASQVGERSSTIAKEIGERSQEWAGKAKNVANQVAGEVKSWRDSKKEATTGNTDAAPSEEAKMDDHEDDKK